MLKMYAKLLNFGAKLESLYTGKIYSFLSLADESGKLINANDDESKEMIVLQTDSVKPIDKIRFITPRYEKLFDVCNLDYVLFNKQRRQVVWFDDTHFAFAHNGIVEDCWHICTFAEQCNESGNKVELISHM